MAESKSNADLNAVLSGFTKIPKGTREDIQQDYTDVVTQIYPLKARMKQLESFCSGYLNVAVDPKVEGAPPLFRPVAPWVLMQVVNYGKITSKTTPDAGWFSQHELAFGFPVESYRIVDGKAVPEDWALVYPFIYVDNPLSVVGGRQIYGWPKRGIVIDQTSPNFEPNAPRCIISISLPTGQTSAVDFAEETQKFLEIYQQRPFLSGRAGLEDALMTVPRAITGAFSAAFGTMETLGLSGPGYMNRDIRSLLSLLQRSFGYTTSFLPALYGGTAARNRTPNSSGAASDRDSLGIITLKQFRDAAKPSDACYQAIVQSRMSIDRMIDGGLLFDPLSGDLTGGIQINLASNDAQPVVKALGIEVSGSATSVAWGDEHPDIIRPMIPFWSKLDLSYGAIDSQYWRTAETGWSKRKTPGERGPQEITYSELGSGARQELGSPFRFQDVNIRVFPLEADNAILQKLIDSYLCNDARPGSGYKFDVLLNDERKSFVCVLIINFAKMEPNSGGDPGNHYGDRMFRFVVPVTMTDEQHKNDAHKNNAQAGVPALIPLYTFVGEEWNFVTEYEVYGRFTLKSTLVSPQNTWMVHPDPQRAVGKIAQQETGLLTVQTLIVPELDKSLSAESLTVLGVDSPGPSFLVRHAAWSDDGIVNYLAKIGLRHFNMGQFYCVSMKQVWDADDVGRLVYKSLVGVKTEFHPSRSGIDHGSLPPVTLKIYKYPGLPLVEKLGLRNGKPVLRNGNPAHETDCELHEFELKNSFYIAGNMTDNVAKNLATQVGESAWTRTDSDPFEAYESQPSADGSAPEKPRQQ